MHRVGIFPAHCDLVSSMPHPLALFLLILLCTAAVAIGCSPSPTSDASRRDVTMAETPKSETFLAETTESEALPRVRPRDIEPARRFFASRVTWPRFDAKVPAYAIESGSGNDGAWFEGKGFFRRSIAEILRDMGDPMVMGPSNVTRDLTRRDGSGDGAYVLHIEMDYIMTVEFDLTVRIDATDDAIHYESHKTDGTSMIDRIDEIIEVQALPDGWCSVAFQSRYDALVVKEKETRQHFEELFARWSR